MCKTSVYQCLKYLIPRGWRVRLAAARHGLPGYQYWRSVTKQKGNSQLNKGLRKLQLKQLNNIKSLVNTFSLLLSLNQARSAFKTLICDAHSATSSRASVLDLTLSWHCWSQLLQFTWGTGCVPRSRPAVCYWMQNYFWTWHTFLECRVKLIFFFLPPHFPPHKQITLRK